MNQELRETNRKLADEFAEKGTVKHFALRLGFMPYNEEQAEAILESCINEKELLETEKELLETEKEYLKREIKQLKFMQLKF